MVSHTLIGGAIALIRAVRTVLGTITTPTARNATVFRFASGEKMNIEYITLSSLLVQSTVNIETEFLLKLLIGAFGSAREFVISLTAILTTVTDPSFRNASIVATAPVLSRQAFTFWCFE